MFETCFPCPCLSRNYKLKPLSFTRIYIYLTENQQSLETHACDVGLGHAGCLHDKH